MNIEYMYIALEQAKKALKKKEIPVGCVIVKNNKILSKSYNTIEKSRNAINHAEIISITKASKKNKNWRLNDCEMYVTLKPCKMCIGAIENSRIKKVYYLLENKNNLEDSEFLEKINNIELENEYSKLLKNIFNR